MPTTQIKDLVFARNKGQRFKVATSSLKFDKEFTLTRQGNNDRIPVGGYVDGAASSASSARETTDIVLVALTSDNRKVFRVTNTGTLVVEDNERKAFI